ncbi:hypothetical protein R3Q06_35165, partial [Rhodococcus erythropolis]|nr:hypothetical protein [Rhodococcus erythropolis]
FLIASSDDAPETASELKFRPAGDQPAGASRIGLRTALRTLHVTPHGIHPFKRGDGQGSEEDRYRIER